MTMATGKMNSVGNNLGGVSNADPVTYAGYLSISENNDVMDGKPRYSLYCQVKHANSYWLSHGDIHSLNSVNWGTGLSYLPRLTIKISASLEWKTTLMHVIITLLFNEYCMITNSQCQVL